MNLSSLVLVLEGITNTIAARLQRYAISLAGYNYDIVYRSTMKHRSAVSVSRLLVMSENDQSADDDQMRDKSKEMEVEMFHVSQLEHLPVKPEVIQQ